MAKSSVTDNPPSSNYQPPPNTSAQADQASYQPFPSASVAVNQKESDKDLGDFLDHLTAIEYDLLTVEHTPAVSSSKVTADVLPTKIKRFGAVPSSEELATRSQFEMPRDTVRRTQRAVKVFSSWASSPGSNSMKLLK